MKNMVMLSIDSKALENTDENTLIKVTFKKKVDEETFIVMGIRQGKAGDTFDDALDEFMELAKKESGRYVMDLEF